MEGWKWGKYLSLWRSLWACRLANAQNLSKVVFESDSFQDINLINKVGTFYAPDGMLIEKIKLLSVIEI